MKHIGLLAGYCGDNTEGQLMEEVHAEGRPSLQAAFHLDHHWLWASLT